MSPMRERESHFRPWEGERERERSDEGWIPWLPGRENEHEGRGKKKEVARSEGGSGGERRLAPDRRTQRRRRRRRWGLSGELLPGMSSEQYSSGSASDRDDTDDVPPPVADTAVGRKKIITRLTRCHRARRCVVPLGRYLPKPNTAGASTSSAPLPVTAGSQDLRPTHVEDGRVIVVPQGDSFLPSKPAATAIITSIQQNFTKGWKNWKAVTKYDEGRTVQAMLDSFLELCTWLPEQQKDVEHAFHKRCSDRYSELMRSARKMNAKPPYMGPQAYQELQDYWNTPEFKEKQEKAKKNRASENGYCIHAGGCVSAGTHLQRLEDHHGRKVSLPELHRNLYLREEDDTFLHDKAKRIQDAYDAGMAEWRASQQQSSGSTSVDPEEEARVGRSVWDRVVGPQKSDRLTGSGSMGPKLFKESILPSLSHSASESTGRSYVAPSSSVIELTEQFNQRLTEQAEQHAREMEEVRERQRIAEERAAEHARNIEERAAEHARRTEERIQQLMAQMNQPSRPSSSSSSSHMPSY